MALIISGCMANFIEQILSTKLYNLLQFQDRLRILKTVESEQKPILD